MDIGELIAPPVGHGEPNSKCPFCPPEKPAGYTTHSGDDNDSSILEAIMNAPTLLTSKQAGARPKDEARMRIKPVCIFVDDNTQSPVSVISMDAMAKVTDAMPKILDKSPKTKSVKGEKVVLLEYKPPFGKYTTEAHHLVSGKQALMGHPFERWISQQAKSKKGRPRKQMIEADTGYSVNNSDNGIHAPSVPLMFTAGGRNFKCMWGMLKYGVKFDAAARVMSATGIQFHKGNHHIEDKDDTKKEHKTYDNYINDYLTEMDDRMLKWSKKCLPCCKGKKRGEFFPSHRVNDALDRLSSHLRFKIKGDPANWEIFLSRYALDFHKAISHPDLLGTGKRRTTQQQGVNHE
jgi:hypothetical protein